MRRVAIHSLCAFILLPALALAQGSRDEERRDPYKEWLSRDVLYIISEEEKEVFQSLTTDAEKQSFIEQFWQRRDPDPNTPGNEFREEHYRRIAYANEKFHAGKPGWKTDRGLIYIKFGPPDRRATNPTGGRVFRSHEELKASGRQHPSEAMTALPYEVWEYRYLPGLGQEVQFEFVSKDGSPDYKLVMEADEKDALSYITGSFITRSRNRRIGLKTFGGSRLDRVEAYSAAFKPLPARVDDTFVTTQVSLEQFPFEVEYETGYVAEETYCDVAVIVPHRSLNFNRKFEDFVAQVEMEIFVRDIRKVVVGHKADRMEARLGAAEFKQAVEESSAYRTRFTLPPGRFLVEVWVKDVVGAQSSFQQQLVVIEDPATEDSDRSQP